MALAHGYALPFVTQKVVGDFASDNAAAAARAIASGATKEAAGSCLDARAINLQMRVPQRTDTNLLTNSAMAGATGSVLPTKWVSGSVNGLTMTISSAFTSAGFQAIDWTVSGTAAEDGTIYIGCEPNDNTNAIPASVGQQYIGAMSLGKQAGTIPATMVMQVLGQVSSAGTVNETANNTTELATLTSSSLTRINTAVLSIASATTDRVNFRLTADVAALDVISFTIRIAAPQVERNDRISPYITTTTGAASRVTGQPSLLIVPQLTRAGVVYPQLPVVSGADFTFTRATTATRVNASGLIESVASGVLRLDYPVTGGCPAALIEPSGTNFARWVNQMTAQFVPAASGGLTTTTGSTDFLAPDGTSGSITKYVGGAASGISQYAYYSGGDITVAAIGQHTFSLFVKRGATNPLTFCALSIEFYAGGSGTIVSYFNLASGTALTAGASIQDYGNGWYRLISAPYTIASGDLSGQLVFFMAEGNNDINWPASGALGLTAYTWGAQFEPSSVATTYIPTTTAAVSRAADVISASGVSGYIGQTEGTIYAEVDLRNLGANMSIINVQTVSYVSGAVRMEVTTSNTLRIQIRDASGTSRLDQIISSPALTSGISKIAIGYSSDASGVVTALNGTIINTTTVSASFGTLGASRVYLGSREASGAFDLFFNNRIRAAALYTTRLSNDQLANITRLT